jgi:hypothetical protein
VPQRPQRPFAVVGVVALGDYLLWNWSLGANHEVVALVSGVTLIPLLIAFAWLLLVAVARLIGHVAQRPKVGSATRVRGGARVGGGGSRGTRVGVAAESALGATGSTGSEETAAGRAAAASPSSKLAA